MRTAGLTSIELFAGAGGLALGLSQAGFEHAAVVEWDHDACRTLSGNANHHSLVAPWSVVEGDVRKFDFAPYADRVALLAAGVPCQPFSLGGKHNGHRDDRNMFPEVTRAIRKLRPKVVVVENVKGLLREKFRDYFSYVLLSLAMPELSARPNENWWEHAARLRAASEEGSYDDLAYNINYQLINCADYGVPQFRERVFVGAVRADLEAEWKRFEPTHCEDALLWAQWIDGSYWREHKLPQAENIPLRFKTRARRLRERKRPGLLRWRTVRDALCGLPEPTEHGEDSRFDNHVANPGARSYPGHSGSSYDWPSKTLKAGVHGVPGGENTVRFSNGRVRYLTVREAARIQTFPDDYSFHGAWCECMRQLGNAVPVVIGRLIGERVRAILETAKDGKRCANWRPRVPITRHLPQQSAFPGILA